MLRRHLIVQGQQCEHQNDVSNLFKVNNKGNRATSLTLLTLCLSVNFGQISQIVLVLP